MPWAAAVADGGWRLTGQKTWTTRGAFCTHLFGLFRTDPEAERHRGMSYFLVPLDAPGVTVRGLGKFHCRMMGLMLAPYTAPLGVNTV